MAWVVVVLVEVVLGVKVGASASVGTVIVGMFGCCCMSSKRSGFLVSLRCHEVSRQWSCTAVWRSGMPGAGLAVVVLGVQCLSR